MRYLNCLTSSSSTLILDTSVIINLHASGDPTSVIENIPNAMGITENVLNELKGEYNDSSDQRDLIQGLQNQGHLKVFELNDGSVDRYAQLVSGSDSLDDGEAATIAFALEKNYLPVIDEKKGLRVLKKDNPDTITPTSIDLFLYPTVIDNLGNEYASDLIYNALKVSRMRIPLLYRDFVIDLIGVERALECRSLPNYKQWKREIIPSLKSP